MEFVETAVFTVRIIEIISDSEYSKLQCFLVLNPQAGDLIPGGSGLRKLRWRIPGEGKRGGLRIIYYFYRRYEQIYFMFVFKKSKQSDLTARQLKSMHEFLKRGVL